MKIKNYVFRRMTPCSLFKISRTIPKPPALMTHRKNHAISARFISLSRQRLCLLLLTSLLGRSADVRELGNRLAGVSPLQREGQSNLAREKEDPEAEMNRTTTRRNGSSSSNTVIFFQVCLQLIISLREEITKFGYWQLWVKSSRQTHLKESICKSKHKYLLVQSNQRRMNLVTPRVLPYAAFTPTFKNNNA